MKLTRPNLVLTVIPDTCNNPGLKYTLEKEFDPGKLVRPGNWWYFHGKLERFVKYDKGFIYENESSEKFIVKARNPYDASSLVFTCIEGKYRVKVKGYPRECVGFFWTNRSCHPYNYKQHGYIVDPSIVEDLIFAEKEYDERRD